MLMYTGHETIDVCRSWNNAMPCLAPGSLSPDTKPTNLETNINHQRPLHQHQHQHQQHQQHHDHEKQQHDSALRRSDVGETKLQESRSVSQQQFNTLVHHSLHHPTHSS